MNRCTRNARLCIVSVALLMAMAALADESIHSTVTHRGALAINAENYAQASHMLKQARQLEAVMNGMQENVCRAAYNVRDHGMVMHACAETRMVESQLETVLLGRSTAQASGAEVAHSLVSEIMRQSQRGALKFSCEFAIHFFFKRIGLAMDRGMYSDAQDAARSLQQVLYEDMFGSNDENTVMRCTTSSFHWNQYYEPADWDVLDHKDVQMRSIRKQAARLGADQFSFFPPTFELPEEKDDFLAESEKLKAQRGGVPVMWIYKPVFGHGGIGVFVNDHPETTELKDEMVVQQYVENPFLLEGRKFHMRYYVGIVSNSPLRLYFHELGLAKISASKHVLHANGEQDNCVTVSNTGTCKNEHFSLAEHIDDDGTGNVWTTRALYRHMAARGVDTDLLHKRVKDVAVKSVLAGQDYIVKTSHNMSQASVGPKIMGLDITFDENAVPYMLELEKGPGLGGGKSAVDDHVKLTVVREMYDMFIHKAQLDHRKRVQAAVIQTLAIGGLRVADHCEGGSHYVSCLEPDDTRHLVDYELEQEKNGGYELAYPHPDSMVKYLEHFDEDDAISRQQNALMHRYLFAKLVIAAK